MKVVPIILGGVAGSFSGMYAADYINQKRSEKLLGPSYKIGMDVKPADSLTAIKDEYSSQLSELEQLLAEIEGGAFTTVLVNSTQGDREVVTVKINTGFLCLRSERTMQVKKNWTLTGQKAFDESVRGTLDLFVNRLIAMVDTPIGIIVRDGQRIASSGTLYGVIKTAE